MSLCQEPNSPCQSRRKSRPHLYVVCFHPHLPDPVRACRFNLARMKSKSVSSTPGASRRFVAPGLHGYRSAAAVAPSIDPNSASVAAAAYWGTPSTHPVIGARIPTPADTRIPFAVDAQVPAATGSATGPLRHKKVFICRFASKVRPSFSPSI
jgi:hypothetical protein